MVPALQLGFHPVQRPKIYEEVAKRLERLILKDFHPGDLLPSERELARLFKVSRGSIRDAIRILEIRGLVKPRQGSGTVVRHAGPSSQESIGTTAGRGPDPGELLNARLTIEPALASRAALQASPKQIRNLQEILSRQEYKSKHGEDAREEDLEFHYAIAKAANSSVMAKVADVLMNTLRERVKHSSHAGDQEVVGHRRVLAAVARRDASGAEAAMRRHLQEVEPVLIKT